MTDTRLETLANLAMYMTIFLGGVFVGAILRGAWQ